MDEDEEQEVEEGEYRWQWMLALAAFIALFRDVFHDVAVFLDSMTDFVTAHSNWEAGQTEFADGAREQIEKITSNTEA